LKGNADSLFLRISQRPATHQGRESFGCLGVITCFKLCRDHLDTLFELRFGRLEGLLKWLGCINLGFLLAT
jgi:hypothetical protein